MKRNWKNEKRRRSLLAKTIESIKESDNDNYENDYNILNKKLFKKAMNKNYNRNSTLKIFSYKQKKPIQNLKSYKENKDYCKQVSFLIKNF